MRSILRSIDKHPGLPFALLWDTSNGRLFARHFHESGNEVIEGFSRFPLGFKGCDGRGFGISWRN